MILLLDVLLLRIQSYRHLIFNYGISFSVSYLQWNTALIVGSAVTRNRIIFSHSLFFFMQLLWKFSVVLVLCEAYILLFVYCSKVVLTFDLPARDKSVILKIGRLVNRVNMKLIRFMRPHQNYP